MVYAEFLNYASGKLLLFQSVIYNYIFHHGDYPTDWVIICDKLGIELRLILDQ